MDFKKVAIFALSFVMVFGVLYVNHSNKVSAEASIFYEMWIEENELEVSESTLLYIYIQYLPDTEEEMEVECYIKEPFYAKLELIKDLKWVSDDGAKRIQQEYKITGMSPGKTELIVNVTGAQPHKMPITIGQIKKVSKITLSPESPTIFVGEELQLEAKAYDEEGNVIPNTPMKWENLDPEIAELTPDGLLRAFESGACKIKASHGSVESETIVTIVKEIQPAKISISTDLIAFPAARKGEKVSTSSEIKNIGDETANAEIKCDEEWLTFVPEKISLEPQESTIITFTANTENLEANSMESAKITFTLGNGDETVIDAIIKVDPSCSIIVEPEVIDFGKISKGGEISKILKITLPEGTHIWIRPVESWIDISKIEGSENEFMVMIDTSKLPDDMETFVGSLNIIPTDILCDIVSVKVIGEFGD